jgi:hypothetical protein
MFESKEQFTMLHKVDEGTLLRVLETCPIRNVKLVIISACHSSRIGNVFRKVNIPVVVSINCESKVYEKAAEQFNKGFLEYLLSGRTPLVAFNMSKSILMADRETSYSCCCEHDHDKDCLWLKLKDTNQVNSMEAHRMHKPTCGCSKTQKGPIDHHDTCD